ncbi:MAG: riboflavin synthase [Verrucomicrobiales bacterium]|nr:riboflavin synthase [Verrucomicrobiales bacterium]
MFTGIVEECGTLEKIEPVATGARLEIAASFAGEVEIGESVAVNGACLTVTEHSDETMKFDLLHETLRLTNLGAIEAGGVVNLERSLAIGDRLSGHFVQGHVDQTCEILAFNKSGNDYRLEIELPRGFAHLVVHKGSICIDGMSLTVAELHDSSLAIWIIPHTREITNLGEENQVGRKVNVEFDLLAKHLARLSGFADKNE